jgi:murein DD-endopeptidase MepM/ murein hydrolase activator NlpD
VPKRSILTQRFASPARAERAWPSVPQWALVAVLCLSGVAAFGLAPDTTLDAVATREVTRALALPPLPPAGTEATERYWREERIRRGDTIGSVLARLGVDDPQALVYLARDPAARPLYQLRPGRPLQVETDAAGTLLELRFATSGGELLRIRRDDGRLVGTTDVLPVDIRWRLASGEIRSSLFGAADAAGIPDAVTLQLAEIFGGDIDFFKDLKQGDRFSVVYEARYLDGELQSSGRVVGAEFVNGGKVLTAFLWRSGDGGEGYYAQDGSPRKKAFLRSPLEFSRVTSGFSGARFHPILQVTRAHLGTDYAAPAGTPVRATGNGRVVFAGSQGGYGNMVHLQHQGTFATVYAHLSRLAAGVKQGARVTQGEVIGYVGQTGWATGPHLHYEFRVGGQHRNPQTLALPSGEPLSAPEHAAFGAAIAPAAAQLALAQSLAGARVAAGR